MSVTLNTRKLLGSDLTAERISRDVTKALLDMDDDAEQMGVRVDWSSIVLKVGDDYYETASFVRTDRQPYLEVAVTAERVTS